MNILVSGFQVTRVSKKGNWLLFGSSSVNLIALFRLLASVKSFCSERSIHNRKAK